MDDSKIHVLSVPNINTLTSMRYLPKFQTSAGPTSHKSRPIQTTPVSPLFAAPLTKVALLGGNILDIPQSKGHSMSEAKQTGWE